MKNHLIKKVLCAVLSVILVFCTGIAAFAESYSIAPIIYIGGIDANPIYVNPNTADAEVYFYLDDDEITYWVAELLTLLVAAAASGDYDEIMNFTYSQIYPLIEDLSMNNDGSVKSENVGPNVYEYSISYYRTDSELLDTILGGLGVGICDRVGYNNVYVFTYDWRLDPLENAALLADFIENVKEKSGKDQVSIVSEGYGSTVALAYLSEYEESAYADLDSFVTVSSLAMGTSLIGDIYTGNIITKDSTISWPNYEGYNNLTNLTSAFIRYTNDLSDNPITMSAVTLVNYILNTEWETQDMIADVITVVGNTITDMYNTYLRQMLRNYVGLWAMVPLEYYDDALEYMFIDQEDPNETLLAKIDSYKVIQENADTILNDALDAGIDVSVVCSWDIQLIPIGNDYQSTTANDETVVWQIRNKYWTWEEVESSNVLYGLSAQSDGIVDTYYASFGATCVSLNNVGDAIGLVQQECLDHDHLSDDYDMLDYTYTLGGIAHYIDASTSALPENTYFIRDMKHGTYDTESNSVDLIVYLAVTDGVTISSSALYQQFMEYTRYVSPGQLNNNYTETYGLYLVGDTDSDLDVDMVDARNALRYALGLEEMPDEDSVTFKNTDAGNSGTITTTDARIILRVALGLQSF